MRDRRDEKKTDVFRWVVSMSEHKSGTWRSYDLF